MSGMFQTAVAPFYKLALTVNAETSGTEVLSGILADNFQSHNGRETKDKATLIKQVGFFWQLIPNLNGQIVKVYHLEDWATAMKQLTG